MSLSDVLAALPQQPQRQDSTNDQLRDLITVANRTGMYDAADCLKAALTANPTRFLYL